MSFNHYYQSELTALRQLGRRFAERSPALAPFLGQAGRDQPAARIIRVTVRRLAKTQPVRIVPKEVKVGTVMVAESPWTNARKPGTSSTASLLAR